MEALKPPFGSEWSTASSTSLALLNKALLKLGHRHVRHKFYDDIQSLNVTISFKSLRYKWVISFVLEWIWHTMETQLITLVIRSLRKLELSGWIWETVLQNWIWGYRADGKISMQMTLIDHLSEHRVMAGEWYLSSSISAPSNKYTLQVICIGIQVLMDMGLPLNLGVIPRHRLNHLIHYLSHNGLTSL